MTAPTEVTTVPATPALARVAGIAPDGRLALRIDFDDAKGGQTVFFTLEAEAVFKPAFPKYRRYSVRREGDSAIRIMKL